MLNNILLKDDQRQTEIVYVQVQVQTSMINQNLDFEMRGMKGMTEETWTRTGQQNPKPCLFEQLDGHGCYTAYLH